MDMQEILAAFASEPLFSTSEKFLKYLGVKTSTQTADPIPFLEMYEDAAKDAGAEVPKPIKKLFGRVEETYFIGSVDDDTLHGGKEGVSFQVECQNQKYEGMFVFAVHMKDGEELTRTDAALLTRGINRLVHQQPAIVLILEDTLLSVATCERTPYKQTWRPGEKLGRVSILKGVNCLNPHRGHIDILESMNVKKAKTFDALYEQWQKVFSTSILTNKFYNELFDWYCWAIDKETGVYFPNRPDDDSDDYEGNDTKIIRLITRVMFVWFVREKNLVPAELFDPNYLRTILKDFDPYAKDSGCYYNAILQNLFFATLNRAIEDEDGKRRFAEAKHQVDAKNLYRYDELFTISRDEIVALFAEVPFVNGSLFDCLDKTKGNDGVDNAFYADGFSRNDTLIASTNHYKYRAFLPNHLFFDPERGLYTIFERYNFTVEENTPLEQQVALDPELLGKVFENLLGVYNGETTREKSGSFYTPREIVEYMVDETLIAYLGDTPFIRSLFASDFVYRSIDEQKYDDVIHKLKQVKMLDPACGSGAYPVGFLNRMVEIIQRLQGADTSTPEALFKLKKFIIENCLYGSDIQCIAAQITRLRFFISLIVNCEKDLTKRNFGIPELPNLETKFVAANSLIGIKKIVQGDLWTGEDVAKIKEELHQVRHDHFNARSARRKRELVRKDEKLRKQLMDVINGHLFSNPEDAWQLARWNPYDQNTSAGFFEPKWMFSDVQDGFDIVIGNPPYVKLEKIKDQSRLLSKEGYEVYEPRSDLYCLFAERGFKLLKEGGVISYIMSNKFLQADYGEPLRKFFIKHKLTKLIDFGDNKIFQGATVYPFIFLAENKEPILRIKAVTMKYYNPHTFVFDIGMWQKDLPAEKLTGDTWMLSTIEKDLLDRIKETTVTLSVATGGAAVRGVTCGATAAFIIPGDTARVIASGDSTSKELIHPMLRGRDLRPWYSECADYFLIGTFPSRNLNIEDYPAIKQHLLVYGKKKLEQTGAPGSRKKTHNDWYETQDQIGYWEDFSKPKIMYQKFQVKPCFIYDESGLYCNDSMWIIPTENKGLVALLNSKMGWWLISRFCTQIQNGYQLIWEYLGKIPVPKQLPSELSDKVDAIIAAKKVDANADTSALEAEIDDIVFDLYGLTAEERALVSGTGK